MERYDQRESCSNHCHPRVIVGIPKAVPPEEQHQRLHTIGTTVGNRLRIVQPFTDKVNKQQQESSEVGHQYPELLQYISKMFCHPTAQKMRHAKVRGNMIRTLEKKKQTTETVCERSQTLDLTQTLQSSHSKHIQRTKGNRD